MNHEIRKEQLSSLILKYKALKTSESSEETIRGWINELLKIFNWDTNDTSQILQEKTLSKREKDKLDEIQSSNSRPDYTFIIGSNKVTFLDAKDTSVNLKTCRKSAFQIKSYGWSIGAPCAFITNFEEFVIYDTTYTPSKEQNTNLGSIYITIDEYVEKLEVLEKHLLKESVVGGSLKEIYLDGGIRGVEKISLDEQFSKVLSNFRLVLANNIYKSNPRISEDDINYYIQVLLNRILFIRVCEAKGIEKNELLLDFKTHGFWDAFRKSSYGDFFNKYDGPIFGRDAIKDIKISDTIFDSLLENIYYPSPYKFDVIPTHVLSDIYELFLGKKLRIEDGELIEVDNSLYEKSNGVVVTPRYIVETLTKKTLDEDYISTLSLKEILDLKIIDISCGSGVFLIEAYAILEKYFIIKFSKDPDPNYQNYFIKRGDTYYLNQEGKRLLFTNCIFGVDINPESVEVTKMSLSLKIIDSMDLDILTYLETIKGSQILNGLGKNIKVGNSLVGSDITEKYPEILKNSKELLNIRFFDWETPEGFKFIFDEKGGFDFVIGNPPYVEAKNYNTSLEIMHKYLKSEFLSLQGKADLLIVFIEKSISLLNPKGKLGYVVQDRFFKTDNGKSIRKIISENRLLENIISFKSNRIFKGKDTYISFLILSKEPGDSFSYKEILGEPSFLENNLLDIVRKNDYLTLDKIAFSDGPWVFDNPIILQLRAVLSKKFNPLGDSIEKIGVGIQTLWNDAYHITVSRIENGIIYGTTKLSGKNIVEFELGSCTRIIENRQNFAFKQTSFDKYCIFPYVVNDGKREEIHWTEFEKEFPKASTYLRQYKDLITRSVQVYGKDGEPTSDLNLIDEERWHLYTRASNIESNLRKKIAIPMTHIETTATFMEENVYCDNSNVTFLDIGVADESLLFALAGVINSNIFSELCKNIALKQTGGYFKFNKQFLKVIPFPKENFFLKKEGITDAIYMNVKNIIKYQDSYISGRAPHLKILLIKEWVVLNENVLNLYEIFDPEVRNIFLDQDTINKRINLLNPC